MTTNFKMNHKYSSDQELLKAWAGANQPNSEESQQLLEIMQFRAAMAQKRADYFACGTLVVWDVDLLSDEVVRSYRADQPYTPTVFRRGKIADAIPALGDWRLEVDRLFV